MINNDKSGFLPAKKKEENFFLIGMAEKISRRS